MWRLAPRWLWCQCARFGANGARHQRRLQLAGLGQRADADMARNAACQRVSSSMACARWPFRNSRIASVRITVSRNGSAASTRRPAAIADS